MVCVVFAGMVRVASSLRDSEGNFLDAWRPRIGFGKKRRTILGYGLPSLRDYEGNFLEGWRPRIGFGKKRRTILGYGLSSLRDWGFCLARFLSRHCRAGLQIVASLRDSGLQIMTSLRDSHASPLCRLLFLLPVLLILCGRCAWGLDAGLDVSQYAHTAWKVRDGFAAAGIACIAQTPDGYLWLGTQFGLYRFDGVRAVPWQPPAGQQLPDNIINTLLVARDGTLWIGTFKGLASWKEGKLTVFPDLAGQYIDALLEDREGTTWVATSANPPPGILCAIRDGRVQCTGDDGTFGIGISTLYEDRKGDLWAGAPKGFWRWKPGRPEFFSMPKEVYTVGFAEDEEGNLLVGVRGGIKRLVNGQIESYPLNGLPKEFLVYRLFRDHGGALWVSILGGGLVHVHQGKTDAFSQTDGLSGDEVAAVFEDREGSIWTATANGLDRFRPLSISTISTKQGLLSQTAYSLLTAKGGTVWIGTNNGLDRWDGGRISAFGTGQGARKPNGRLNGETPFSLFQDSSGQIWVSTPREFGYLENERFFPLRGLPSGFVHDIAETSPGHLWLAYQGAGLVQLFQGKIVQLIPWSELKPKDFGWTLAADPTQKGVWVGFLHGDVAYVADGRLRASYSVADGLGRGRVNALRFGPRGTLWAATEGGLSRIKNGHITTLTSKNGLPCDRVHWTIEDDDHFVWVYMPCGLARIARSELDAWVSDPKRVVQTTVFGASDGVATRAGFAQYTSLVTKSPDGKIWFTPYDGVSVIDPRHLPYNKVPPPVHIEQVIADRKTHDAAFHAKSGLRLPALARDLQIDYTALSLAVPEKVRFRYKLEGFDNDWQDAGNRRQAFYTNLSPKKYTFRVKACNNSGVWNEEGASLDFWIAPAYYQTNWFRALCVAAFLALLGALYQIRLRKLAREYEIRLEERVGERTRIARELHDSLLQGFQGLMFRLQAVREMLGGRAHEEAIQALDTALESGDKAIAEGRDTVSDLRQSVAGESDIAQALTALGEELAAQNDNGRAPYVRVLVEGKRRELSPVLRDEIYRIGREAMRNAFRHARAQKIEAEITYGDSEFLFHVRDDGIGIAGQIANKGSRAGHWGLPGMRERAKSFGGKLQVWSEHGAGTEIELMVPAAIAYGQSKAGRRFWFSQKKADGTDGKQS